MGKYSLEFILTTYGSTQETVGNSLKEFAEELEVSEIKNEEFTKSCNFKVTAKTLDPTLIFDVCSQFGRIKEIKINEE
ncbi:MAG: hypothetical protein PHO70_05035 [Candidatus Omnitrophica bacterium]|nr:hypothetical protein [Candidatus Omnitrophota bacterium]